MPREKPRRGKRSISRNEWAQFAEELKRELGNVNYGNRLARYAELADKHGLDANVIRRTIRALSALDEIAQVDPELAQRLRRAPLAVAEVVARWLKHDRIGALAAGRLYLSGEFTTLSLTQAEITARPVGAAKKSTVADWRRAVRARAEEILGSSYIFENEFLDQSQVPPLWGMTYKRVGDAVSDEIIIFGPGPWRGKLNYRSQMAYILYSAAGIFFRNKKSNMSIIILPNIDMCAEYKDYIKNNPMLKESENPYRKIKIYPIDDV